MSQADQEIVRALWRAFERLEVPPEAFAEEVEWHTASDIPDPETCRGVKAIQRMLAAGWENIVDPGMQVEEVCDAGERIVVRWRGWGTGRASGVPIDWREAHTYLLRAGKVVEVREYRTWEEALAAAGASRSWRAS
jgi:ketosteroid isomerase-like protein